MSIDDHLEIESIKYEENKRKNENTISKITWIPTGKIKKFYPGTHFIYAVVNVSEFKNGEIKVPKGYKPISSEVVTGTIKNEKHKGDWYYPGYFQAIQIKYNFINDIPVIAIEYENEQEETSYPYPGKPIEKAKQKKKIFKKNINKKEI